MSSTSPNNNRASKSQKMVWFFATTIMAICALVLWGVSSVAANNKKLQEQQIDNEQVVEDTGEVGQVSLTQSIESLNEFEDDVAPIDYETVIRDVNSYPAEFKDSKYLTRYKGKWTLQIMTVNEHSIIKDYLDTRDDRDKFAYFRYLDEAGNKKYVLTYDVMDDAQQAAGTIGQVDFELPSSISVLPIEIKRYIKRIDNYERAEALVDFSEDGQREIKLVPTRRQVPIIRKTTPQLNSSNGINHGGTVSAQSQANSNGTEENTTPDNDTQNSNADDKAAPTPFKPVESVQDKTVKADDAIEDKIEQINKQAPQPKADEAAKETTKPDIKPVATPEPKPAQEQKSKPVELKEDPKPKPFLPDEPNQ